MKTLANTRYFLALAWITAILMIDKGLVVIVANQWIPGLLWVMGGYGIFWYYETFVDYRTLK